jgi:hypothetical protein
VSLHFGGTSGRYQVAEVLGHVFPAYRALAASVFRDLGAPDEPRKLAFGPYPADVLNYRSKRIVRFHTPANREGLGTLWDIEKNNDAIDGVGMLVCRAPDLFLLSVRLPENLQPLTHTIVSQFEGERGHRSCE